MSIPEYDAIEIYKLNKDETYNKSSEITRPNTSIWGILQLNYDQMYVSCYDDKDRNILIISFQILKIIFSKKEINK